MISALTPWVILPECRDSDYYCRHCLDHCFPGVPPWHCRTGQEGKAGKPWVSYFQVRWWTWLLQSDRHGLLPGSPFCNLPALHSALSCAPHTHALSAPSPAALAFRTVTATVWIRCHSSWEELRGVHSGKPVTAGTQPGWKGNKSTSIPGAPFLPVQFTWFKHCFFHYWEKTVHATTNYSLNFAILTIFKKRKDTDMCWGSLAVRKLSGDSREEEAD